MVYRVRRIIGWDTTSIYIFLNNRKKLVFYALKFLPLPNIVLVFWREYFLEFAEHLQESPMATKPEDTASRCSSTTAYIGN